MNIELPSFELPFFTNLFLLLVFAKFFGELMERIKQPAMIGEIIAGIVLGPTLLNFIHRTEDIGIISDIGVFLLVIIAGLEINFDDILKSIKGRSIIISLMAFFLPIGCGFMVGYLFNQQMMTIIFIGLCVAITALPVSIRILMDLGKLNSFIGQKIISVAIFDDILALTLLGFLLNLNGTDMTIGSITKISLVSFFKLSIFITFLVVSYLMIKKISKNENYIEFHLNKILKTLRGKESLFAILFLFILVFSTITETLGFHFIIGAFFAAMFINKNLVGETNLKTFHTTTNGMAMGFLAPIFFTGIGLEFNFGSIQNYWLLAAIILVSFASKIFGGFLGCRLAGLDNKVSVAIGIGLNARGIMELVIANIAYKSGLIDVEIFSMLVIMGLLTTLSTPILLNRAFKFVESATKKIDINKTSSITQ
jgi:Kef-type K+ transport system membrane component KefB